VFPFLFRGRGNVLAPWAKLLDTSSFDIKSAVFHPRVETEVLTKEARSVHSLDQKWHCRAILSAVA
jgi:hypothetical protein